MGRVRHPSKRGVKSDIDMDRPTATADSEGERIVDHPVGIPSVGIGSRFIDIIASLYKIVQYTMLMYCLRIILINPFIWSVGRYDNQRQRSVKGFGDSRSVVQNSSARCAHYRHRGVTDRCQAKSDESRRTFICNRN